ncbi:MAG: DUF4278 domain-containing protein [Phormidesmis sp.]
MKLTYRGIEYDYNPPVLEVVESEMACQYRGARATYTYVRHVPIPQPAERLTYRGVAYQTTRQGQIQQLGSTAQPTNADAVAGVDATPATWGSKLTSNRPAAQARRELLRASSQQHQQSIARVLQHRIEVAKAQGNQMLLQQLESEMRQSVAQH